MSETMLGLTFIVGAALSGIPITVMSCCEVKLAKESDFYRLKQRLRFYADLQGGLTKKVNVELDADQHKLLLGVLKKIEAKNAVLLAITLFLFSVLIQSVRIIKVEDFSLTSAYLFLFSSGLLLGVLFSRLQGASHIGQREFRKMTAVKENRGEQAVKCQMQVALMENLLIKETQFSISVYVLLAALAAIVIGSLGLYLQ